MEFFSRTLTIDWMGKAKYWMAISVALLVLGGVFIAKHGGIIYGIDFKGGTLVYVRFAEDPQVDRIRGGLAQHGMGDAVIQKMVDPVRANVNEVSIYIQQQAEGDDALEAGRNRIIAALRGTFGGTETTKADLNSASARALADSLTRRDPLGLGPTSADRYKEIAQQMVSARDTQHGGLFGSFEQAAQASGAGGQIAGALETDYHIGNFTIRKAEGVGPRVGAQLRQQALWATLSALGGMLVYIAFRFEWIYGAAAVLAVFHDVAVTLGLFSVFGHDLNLTEVAALLTLVGYSVNDKIVIFDRIRENLRLMRREPLSVIVNRSINQTFSRTVLTGGMTFFSLIILFLMGGEVLRGFSFILVVGIIVGTYSSFGIAAPLVVAWDKWRGGRLTGATVSVASRQSGPVDKRVAAAGRR